MVAESWFSSLWKTSRKEPEKLVIGVLAFEVSGLMSKVVHLWQCLSDKQVVRLREDIMTSVGVRKLVSDDDDFLVQLACSEFIENLGFVARSVARLGKRCTDPVLQRLENVFDDLIKNDAAGMIGWEFTWKKMERKVKKMERFIATSTNLYQELEVLTELEQSLRRMHGSAEPNFGSLLEFQQKVVWQRQEVRNLRESSLWNRNYNYVVRLLVKSLFTIFRRIQHVFGIRQTTAVGGTDDSGAIINNHLPRSHSISILTQSSVHPSENNLTRFASGPLGRPATKSGSITKSGPISNTYMMTTGQRQTPKSGPISNTYMMTTGQRQTPKSGPISNAHKMTSGQRQTPDHSSVIPGKHGRPKTKRLTPVGPFKGCMMGGSRSPVLESCEPVISSYVRSNGVYSGNLNGLKDADAEPLAHNNIFHSNIAFFSSKCRLLSAPPSTLGGVALSIHYANVIIIIEKLVASPHLIGPDARDDLYYMLPTSIRAALRGRLKSYVKNMASSFYDPDLASEWSDALTRILEWLAPLGHNMIRWQSERNFEQQHLISRTNVLLVQTLYFADLVKTEAAITELLVGLNYLWRFGRELNAKALLECASSGTFDEFLDSKG